MIMAFAHASYCFFGCFDLLFVCIFFFFFQAEDGIRDVAVTGVQTCALPISHGGTWVEDRVTYGLPLGPLGHAAYALVVRRSEERRVGKECRSRWSPYH